MNRKRILESLETARQGYNQICVRYIDSINPNDILMVVSASAQHHQLNSMIFELGGESVDIYTHLRLIRNQIAPNQTEGWEWLMEK